MSVVTGKKKKKKRLSKDVLPGLCTRHFLQRYGGGAGGEGAWFRGPFRSIQNEVIDRSHDASRSSCETGLSLHMIYG